MRSADFITLVRTLLVFPIAYAILVRYNPWITILLIVIMFAMDAFDGYAALFEASKGKLDFLTYLRASVGDSKAREVVGRYKRGYKGSAYGPRIDIAGDRVTEYVFWIVFVYLNLIPIWVLFLIVLRHSFVDAIMGAKGTSSKAKGAFARIMYTSALGRGGAGALKVITFSYLVLVYVSGYPIIIGYVLTALLVVYILLRGISELYDNLIA